MRNTYFSMETNKEEANINIFGDITSNPWQPEEGSLNILSKALDNLGDVKRINVYINSYGGEVAEGLAIYNALKRHKTKVTTYCDGFACSIASVIFMAGDKRIMSESSLLMIHNAWTYTSGNADQLRKEADDLEKITQASVAAYRAHSNLSEEQIKDLMNKESWLLPEEALEYGFATKVETTKKDKASQSSKFAILEAIKLLKANNKDEDLDESEDESEAEDDEESTEETNQAAEDEEETEETSTEDEETSEDEEEDEEDNASNQTLDKFFSAILKI